MLRPGTFGTVHWLHIDTGELTIVDTLPDHDPIARTNDIAVDTPGNVCVATVALDGTAPSDDCRASRAYRPAALSFRRASRAQLLTSTPRASPLVGRRIRNCFPSGVTS